MGHSHSKMGGWVNTLEVIIFFMDRGFLEKLPFLPVFANYEGILPCS